MSESVCGSVRVVERSGLLNYLNDLWNDIWDLTIYEVDELRDEIPTE